MEHKTFSLKWTVNGYFGRTSVTILMELVQVLAWSFSLDWQLLILSNKKIDFFKRI